MPELTREDDHILFAALTAQLEQEYALWERLSEDQSERAEEMHMEMEHEVEDDEADLLTIAHHAALTALIHGDPDIWDALGDETLDAAEGILYTTNFRRDHDEDDEGEEESSEYESYDDDDDGDSEDEW